MKDALLKPFVIIMLIIAALLWFLRWLFDRDKVFPNDTRPPAEPDERMPIDLGYIKGYKEKDDD